MGEDRGADRHFAGPTCVVLGGSHLEDKESPFGTLLINGKFADTARVVFCPAFLEVEAPVLCPLR
jgi:hypothetical protein